MPSEQPSYDFIFAGGGLAGLSLAWYLVRSRLRDSRILLLDKEPKQKNDRTWCYWSNRPGDFDSLAVQEWPEMFFSHPAGSLRIPLGAYRYRMTRGIDFYRFVNAELKKFPNVHLEFGEIQSLTDNGDFADVEMDRKHFRGQWVFNSLFRPADFPAPSHRYTFLKQHFLGWEVETERELFDPAAFTMFDFRTPQQGAVRFFYVLPVSSRRALVEYTIFSDRVLTEPEYRPALETYLREVVKADRYEIVATEFGVIPMTDYPFRRRLGRRILAIGSLGGRVKPSTGFAFRRIQSDSQNIVRSLEKFGDPFHLPADSIRHRFSDSAMLRIMRGNPERIADIFQDMFRKNPVERVFQFLDEEIGVLDNLRLFLNLPKTELFLAGLGYVKSPGTTSSTQTVR
jgi:lycopene beta-cyclase